MSTSPDISLNAAVSTSPIDVTAVLHARVSSLTTSIEKERAANRELARRLALARSAAQHVNVLSAERAFTLMSAEKEALAWRRVARAMVDGAPLVDALKAESAAAALAVADAGGAGSDICDLILLPRFWEAVKCAGLSVQPPRRAPSQPSPQPACPLIETFLVVGPSPEAVLAGLVARSRRGLAAFVTAPPPPVEHAAATVLFSATAHGSPLPADASLLAAFAAPSGASVSRCAAAKGSHVSATTDARAGVEALFGDCQRRGPASHVFLLSAGTERDAAEATSDAGALGAGARARYGVCLRLNEPMGVDTIRHSAGLARSGDVHCRAAVSAPRVLVAITRYPAFGVVFDVLRDVSARWRSHAAQRLLAAASTGCADSLLVSPTKNKMAPAAATASPTPPKPPRDQQIRKPEPTTHIISPPTNSPLRPPSSLPTSLARAADAVARSVSAGRNRASDGATAGNGGAARSQSPAARAPSPGAGSLLSHSIATSFRSVAMRLLGEPVAAPQPASAVVAHDSRFFDSLDMRVEEGGACVDEASGGGVMFGGGRSAAVAAPERLPRRLSTPGQSLLDSDMKQAREVAGEGTLADGEVDGETEDDSDAIAAARIIDVDRPAMLAALASCGAPSWLSEACGPLLALPVPAHNGDAPPSLRSDEARTQISEWALPTLLSLLPADSLLLVLGAALTEHRVIFVGGTLSMDAVSSAALALSYLLTPLHWEGALLPSVPLPLSDLLSTPTPLIAGVPRLPADWVQDDETLIVLLDRETLRIPVKRGRGGEADLLTFLPPGASALVHTLAPLASALTSDSGASNPSSARRPCYRPSPAQHSAAKSFADTIAVAVNGMLEALLHAGAARFVGCSGAAAGELAPLATARTRLLSTVPEAERPFWLRFCDTQMVACAYDDAALRRVAAVISSCATSAASEVTAISSFGPTVTAENPARAGNESIHPALIAAAPPPPPVPSARHATWKKPAPSSVVLAVRSSRK